MYADNYSEEITGKLAKLKKKDSKNYKNVRKKMDWILEHPEHKYKNLHYSMKGMKRIHLGSFVLTFKVDYSNEIISFEDFDHHDKIYKS